MNGSGQPACPVCGTTEAEKTRLTARLAARLKLAQRIVKLDNVFPGPPGANMLLDAQTWAELVQLATEAA